MFTIHGVIRTAKSRVANGHGKTYLYRFDADTKLNVCKNKLLKLGKVTSASRSEFTIFVSNSGQFSGAGHCDDLFYMFASEYDDPPALNSKEHALIERSVELWSSFAINGTPSRPEVVWAPLEASDKAPVLLKINNEELKMISQPEIERIQVWNEIYEEVGVDLY